MRSGGLFRCQQCVGINDPLIFPNKQSFLVVRPRSRARYHKAMKQCCGSWAGFSAMLNFAIHPNGRMRTTYINNGMGHACSPLYSRIKT